VVETEAGREALRKELQNAQRKLAELADELRVREKSNQAALDESRRNERRIDEQRHAVELALEGANADLTTHRLQLSTAEGRLAALEGQLTRYWLPS